MGVSGGLTLNNLIEIGTTWGPFGIVLVLWWFDQRRVQSILTSYKADVKKVSAFYHSNVKLVESYEKLSGDLAGIITLNTQIQTQLVEQIKTNMFCPLVRQEGPNRN